MIVLSNASFWSLSLIFFAVFPAILAPVVKALLVCQPTQLLWFAKCLLWLSELTVFC